MRTSTLSICVFVAIIGLCLARPQEYEKSAPSEFGYEVNDPESKNNFGHSEKTDDNGKTEGSYFVNLADGRRMTVEYTVDGDGGFMPKITFSDIP